VICFGFVLARVLPWLKRQHAAHPNAVANLTALAVVICVMFALALPGLSDVAVIVGRVVLTDLTYPLHDKTITVTNCGRICFDGRKVNLSQVFAGQNVG
jgi:hypothetical protein